MNEIDVAIETMLHSQKFNSVYIYGDTSSGKTYSVEKYLKENNKEGVFVNTHITPLSLYIHLYNNRDKILIFDDLDKLDDTIIAIFKAATWQTNGKRTLNWISTSNVLEEVGIPNEFEFLGKIIITCNNENRHKKFEPLLARMFVVNKVTSRKEFEDICSKIFEDYGLDTYEGFMKDYINIYTDGLHLRNILKYCELCKAGFVEDAKKLFGVNEYFKFFAVSQVSLVSMLQKQFEEKFGLGRATFFRYWKKFNGLKKEGW